MKLSHTAKEKYLTCSEKYRLYYIEKLRSRQIGSALFFGNALDAALNRLLLDKKKEHTEEEKKFMELGALDRFDKEFKYVNVNTEEVDISLYLHARYFKSDFDLNLLTDTHVSDISEKSNNLDLHIPDYNYLQQFLKEMNHLIKNKTLLEINEQKIYNYIGWLCLKEKAHMLIKAYANEIIPKIYEVYSVQEEVHLKDENDIVRGFIDIVASFTDKPGIKYIIDNKTSSRPYSNESVSQSEQLATYAEYKDIKNCAYIVLEKKIRKREPKVRINIIRDTIKDEFIDKTFDNISKVFYGIKDEKFEKNWDNCFQYGRICEYIDVCKNNNKDYLVDMKEVYKRKNKE